MTCKYLHLVDDIIVIKEGQITEHGTFDELMSNNGNLAKLVGDHVQIMDKLLSKKHVSGSFEKECEARHGEEDQDDVVPTDTKPIKLVLEDQSINYKGSSVLAYLAAGYGVVTTLAIFAFFFLVHVLRVGSGKSILFDMYRFQTK